MGTVVVIVVGVGSALVASLIFWYLQYRVFRVRIELSPTIAKYSLPHDPPGVFRYQFQVKNGGRRDAYDLRISLRCSIQGLVRKASRETFDVSEWTPPMLARGRTLTYRASPHHLPDRYRRLYWKYFPPRIQAAFEDGTTIDLADFLEIADGGTLDLYVTATDSLSGSRSLTHRTYTTSDIQVGKFEQGSFRHTGLLYVDEPVEEDPPSADAEPTG